MGSVAAVAVAVGGLISLIILLINRKAAREAKRNEPAEQNRTRKEEVAREIVRDDERGANASLDDDLRRYHELRGSLPSDRKRPDSSTNESGPADHTNG